MKIQNFKDNGQDDMSHHAPHIMKLIFFNLRF
jgi:hypothetical protein